MFQFTTTTVINSAVRDNGEAAWKAINAQGEPGTDIFHVARVSNFKKSNIKNVFKTLGFNGETAKVTIALKDPTPSNVFRLSLYIGLSEACQESRYSNDFYKKGKPFSVEFPWMGSEQATVENLMKLANKYQVFVFGEKLLNISKTAGHHLAIEATNEFQKFVKVDLEKFVEPTSEKPMGEYVIVKSLESGKGSQIPVQDKKETIADTEGVYQGLEGFGTYSFLLHNLRIPTFENSRPFGVGQAEAPIPGALYDEYVIQYKVDRGILGSNAVGDTVTSVTNHVFYVRQGVDISTAFSTDLNKVQTITPVQTKAEAAAKFSLDGH